jgi:predicted kinase
MLILMAGLPGAGKSTLARALAPACHSVVLDKDELRHLLFPAPLLEYSAEQDDFCQSLMLDTAAYLLARHPDLHVFLDGRTFSRAYQIQNAIARANLLATPWRILVCMCSDATARDRLDPSHSTHPAQNRNFDLYRKLQAEFEAIPLPHLVIDTDQSLDDCVAAALAYLNAGIEKRP